MSNLIDELTAEIQTSNSSYSSEEIANQIVSLVENDILPSAIDRIRLPRLPSPIDLRREHFKIERRRGKKDVDELENRVKFVQELGKLKRDYYFSDLTSVSFQAVDAKDFSQKPFFYDTKYLERKKDRKLTETEVILPKLEPKSFSDVSEREVEKPHELVTIDLGVSKKIFSDPNFERAIASVESRIREKFRNVPDISFNISLRQGIDEYTREKTIIHIKIPNSNFKEKMNYWLRIDFEVRNAIKAAGFEEADRKAINRNLVTHIESI
ncbi:MAG: hypothetical protein OEY22_11570 [Candidatus Bathyarchaeota archaeon]|nr:hypothetical protein [Candidatus Bathyarchaeota archaeon]MDH5787828.1 hypothetical protein [Candidatus Bathyarchaeota archaeon]